MTEPTKRDIDKVLTQLDDSPRTLAKAAVKRWKSDAERHKRPLTNVRDSGAPLLDVNDVLNYADHDRRLGKR